MELNDERLAMGLLREARNHMRLASKVNPTRELSVALTQCETALLWLEHDYQGKLSQGGGEHATSDQPHSCTPSFESQMAGIDTLLDYARANGVRGIKLP